MRIYSKFLMVFTFLTVCAVFQTLSQTTTRVIPSCNDSLYRIINTIKIHQKCNFEVIFIKYNEYYSILKVLYIISKDGGWSSSLESFTCNENVIKINKNRLKPKIEVDSAINTLNRYMILSIKSDSMLYDTISMGSSNGYSIPFIRSDGGYSYSVKVMINNGQSNSFEFSCPESTYKELSESKIFIPDLQNFINILTFVRQYFTDEI